jgi:L-ribulose-5-phosphate 3-epimerase
VFTRRDWMQAVVRAPLAVAAAAAAEASEGGQAPSSGNGQAPAFCFFSKHLPDLGWSDLGRVVKEIGFDGVDLTVRSKGHVLPERAVDDLPRAIDAIRSRGIGVPMITTELTSSSHPTARPLLQAAARSGVRYFKPGYWYYRSPDVRARVNEVAADLEGLAALARECGIEMGFHNHAAYVGAALWDVAPALDRLDARWVGYYFDPRHAVAEGGGGAWKAAAHLAASRLKMVALKDFFWAKGEKGWRIEDCPLGEGAVDWSWVADRLHEARFAGPISIHLEYEIPGRTAQERTARTVEAATRDMTFARRVFYDRSSVRG